MGVTYSWDDEQTKTAVIYRYEDRWTWEESIGAIETSQVLWESVRHQVDIIVDFTRSAGFPSGNMIGHFRDISAYYAKSPQAGNTAVVGANDFFRKIAELFSKVYIRHRFTGNTFLVRDLEAARKILADYREKANQKG